MTSSMQLGAILPVLSAIAWFATGALIGVAYFLTLRWNVHVFAANASMLLPLGIQLARFALIAATLTFIVSQFGALPLLAATAGLLSARMAILRWRVPL